MKLQVWLIWTGVVAAAADMQCESDEFKCTDGSNCINAHWFCDGLEDCYDGSDEYPLRNVSNYIHTNNGFCRGSRGHICAVPKIPLPQVKGVCKQDWECKRDEFECADGSQCVDASSFCNGYKDCRDGSDEQRRNVNSKFYDENSTFCRKLISKYRSRICVVPKTSEINVSTVCEKDWQCKSDEFECADGSQCVDASSFCNDYEDCRDGSDEQRRNVNSEFYDENLTFCRKLISKYTSKICVVPKTSQINVSTVCEKDWQCKSDEFECADGSRCIQGSWFCDGGKDCQDGSDEYPLRNVSNSKDQNYAFCRGSRFGHICAVPKVFLPQVKGYCQQDVQCESHEFECSDGSGCFDASWFCNEEEDCQDGSDEYPLRNVSNSKDPNYVFCRGVYGHICAVPKVSLPQVEGVCQQVSQCQSDEFECTDGSKCIPGHWFCIGRQQCRDGSDEKRRNVKSEFYDENSTFCRRRIRYYRSNICVIPKTSQLNVSRFCEKNWQCKRDEFECADGSGCIPVNEFCDGTIDCQDWSDELLRNVNSDFHDENSTFCRRRNTENQFNICVVPKTSKQNALTVCEKNWQCKSNEFECADGSRCIGASSFCDGRKDCLDESDEILTNRTTYKTNEIYYGGPDRICAIPDSNSEVKEEYCAIKNASCTCKHQEKDIEENNCFRCLSNPHYVLQVSQVCDGIVDCPDLSDECLCPSNIRLGSCQWIVVGKNLRPNVHITCGSGNQSTMIVDEIKICDQRPDCPDSRDEKGCFNNNDSSHISTQQEIPIKCQTYFKSTSSYFIQTIFSKKF